MTSTIELTTRARPKRFSNINRTVPTVTPCGLVTYLCLENPEYQYDNARFLSFKIKIAVSLHAASIFRKECDSLLLSVYPDVDLKNAIMPIYCDPKGIWTIVAESRNKPRTTGKVAFKSQVRIGGSLLPFERNGRHGINLRFTHVEVI